MQELFADSYNYMKSGTLMRQVINKINQIDFNNQKERHLFNDIYEKILRDLQSAGNAGEYYTPRAVTQFMTDMVNPKLGQIVLDPACGTGGFLVCALEHMKKQAGDAGEWQTLEANIRAIEKKPLPHMLAITNLFLHEVSVPNVARDNALTRRPYRSYTEKDRVDVVLTNPPFGGTEAIWYFEHPMPADRKQYSKTRPIAIEEFELEKAWWDDREENEHAWRVTREEIEARGYNLDIKNPYEEEQRRIDPAVLLARYEEQLAAAQATRTALKETLAAALAQTEATHA